MDELNKLIELVKKSLGSIDAPYFNLATTYEPSGIVRKRVFCYEFYHQMRLALELEESFSLYLNGEIDKRGHIGFASEDRKNPDFVFHMPGKFEGNTVVVEVKGKLKLKNDQENIRKDFRTLMAFVQKYQYRLGLFILYNYTLVELKQSLQVVPEGPPEVLDKIRIICIKEARADTEECTLAEFLA